MQDSSNKSIGEPAEKWVIPSNVDLILMDSVPACSKFKQRVSKAASTSKNSQCTGVVVSMTNAQNELS